MAPNKDKGSGGDEDGGGVMVVLVAVVVVSPLSFSSGSYGFLVRMAGRFNAFSFLFLWFHQSKVRTRLLHEDFHHGKPA